MPKLRATGIRVVKIGRKSFPALIMMDATDESGSVVEIDITGLITDVCIISHLNEKTTANIDFINVQIGDQ